MAAGPEQGFDERAPRRSEWDLLEARGLTYLSLDTSQFQESGS